MKEIMRRMLVVALLCTIGILGAQGCGGGGGGGSSSEPGDTTGPTDGIVTTASMPSDSYYAGKMVAFYAVDFLVRALGFNDAAFLPSVSTVSKAVPQTLLDSCEAVRTGGGVTYSVPGASCSFECGLLHGGTMPAYSGSCAIDESAGLGFVTDVLFIYASIQDNGDGTLSLVATVGKPEGLAFSVTDGMLQLLNVSFVALLELDNLDMTTTIQRLSMVIGQEEGTPRISCFVPEGSAMGDVEELTCGIEEFCTGGADDNGDGKTDCDDLLCMLALECNNVNLLNVCGNGLCEPEPENMVTCPEDCTEAVCGNGVCEPTENDWFNDFLVVVSINKGESPTTI